MEFQLKFPFRFEKKKQTSIDYLWNFNIIVDNGDLRD